MSAYNLVILTNHLIALGALPTPWIKRAQNHEELRFTVTRATYFYKFGLQTNFCPPFLAISCPQALRRYRDDGQNTPFTARHRRSYRRRDWPNTSLLCSLTRMVGKPVPSKSPRYASSRQGVAILKGIHTCTPGTGAYFGGG